MLDDLVSIVTPAYNASRFVVDTIASIQAQTHQTWEALVVDDCSSDNTGEIVKKIAARDARVKYVPHVVNKGPAGARNTALEHAAGRYVAFLDSDDLWLPEKLERQLAFMKQTAAVLSFTEYRRITEDGTATGRHITVPASLRYADLLKNTAIVTSTTLVDRHQLGQIKLQNTYYDDFALWLSILRRGYAAYGLQEDLVRYRIVGRSVSRSKTNSAKWVWRTYRDIERLNFPYAVWCFANYALRGYLKYRAL